MAAAPAEQGLPGFRERAQILPPAPRRLQKTARLHRCINAGAKTPAPLRAPIQARWR
ncbi:hypothetical protein BN2497_11135 [Janthinobacterium sp. CG23_2]|nr:hypothetical protein BN2497_11135 [Janthinobacterium sp. CG23_2]CUU31965.1 hypothetical protein BN3177_11135 [Janthinobacterium sp. CG23_2]